MKWRKKQKKRSIPKDGELRIISKFLYYPMCIENEYRWFEKVKIKQEYIAMEMHKCRGVFGGDSFYTTGGYWKNLEYIDK